MTAPGASFYWWDTAVRHAIRWRQVDGHKRRVSWDRERLLWTVNLCRPAEPACIPAQAKVDLQRHPIPLGLIPPPPPVGDDPRAGHVIPGLLSSASILDQMMRALRKVHA